MEQALIGLVRCCVYSLSAVELCFPTQVYEVNAMAKELAEKGLNFATKNGGYFTWEKCYDEISRYNTRLVLVTSNKTATVLSSNAVVAARKR